MSNAVKKILFTGFEPFGGESTNPSIDAVMMLPDSVNGVMLVKKVLPVTYEGAPCELKNIVDSEKPDAVVCVGQAGGATGIRIEKVAINYADASLEDNAGVLKLDMNLKDNGKEAYFSTLPITEILSALKKREIPAGRSLSAGAFVCNCIFYNLMEMCAEEMDFIKFAGFVHVPYTDEQVKNKKEGTPSMKIGEIAEALETIAAVIANGGKNE